MFFFPNVTETKLSHRLGEVCSHVAGLLFKVEASVRLKVAAKSCTSLPCAWNQAHSKKVCYCDAV